jgi:hypothetical protein
MMEIIVISAVCVNSAGRLPKCHVQSNWECTASGSAPANCLEVMGNGDNFNQGSLPRGHKCWKGSRLTSLVLAIAGLLQSWSRRAV